MQLQQKPDLLLATVVAARILADEVQRHLIAQPVTGARHNADVVGQQAHFFVEFAEHGLLGRFAVVDAALWKLPGMGANALAPEHLVTVD